MQLKLLRIPSATYRLQFHSGFRFADASRIVTYLRDLGITDIYSSPILKARAGSTHGYDVTDPNAINDELGGEAAFDEFVANAKERGLGLLVDIVPNHMATSSENVWWMNVLENGAQSRFVNYFDIEWTPPHGGQQRKKVLLPILGRPYGEALESQELKLRFDSEGFFVTYYEKRIPITPMSYEPILSDVLSRLDELGQQDKPSVVELRQLVEQTLHGSSTYADDPSKRVLNSRFLKNDLARLAEDGGIRAALDDTLAAFNGSPENPSSFDRLDALLDQQWYQLAYWRLASEGINYRRFFDVTDLVGVRVEDPEVFEARHAFLFRLIQEEKITGLRIDHIDGLYDPVPQLKKMQSRIDRDCSEGTLHCGFYVVVEKILARGEELPPDFAAHGTTGYDFLNDLNNLFVSGDGLRELQKIYVGYSGVLAPFQDIVRRSKERILDDLFAGEIRSLGAELARIAAQDRNARDFAAAELTAALAEVTMGLDVYRTYIRNGSVSEVDRERLMHALTVARREGGERIDPRVFDFLERVLLVNPPRYAEEHRAEWLAFVMRWQQFTGRVMAKGVEDTAFYVFNRLISMNEVGGEPAAESFEGGASPLHERNRYQLEHWPHSLNATSTHDTKRSEDVRARINVLSELPCEFDQHLKRWSAINADKKQIAGGLAVPDANEEMLIYQSLLGVWPLDEAEESAVAGRMREYVEKAAREAKSHTSWLRPNVAHEEALKNFCGAILEPSNRGFLADFREFQQKLAFFGFINSLAQVVVKATAPGVPDFYQGTELWDFSLVDPDNRRPVDYERRIAALDELRKSEVTPQFARKLADSWPTGIVKLFTTWRVLTFRRDHRELFEAGEYIPLTGSDRDANLFAYLRRSEEGEAVVIVPRLIASSIEPSLEAFRELWAGTILPMPRSKYRNVFTGNEHDASEGHLSLAELFSNFPVALLEKI